MTPEERRELRKNKLLKRAANNEDAIHAAMLSGNVKQLEEVPVAPVQANPEQTPDLGENSQTTHQGAQTFETIEATYQRSNVPLSPEENDESTNMLGGKKPETDTNLFEKYRKMQKAEKEYVRFE